MSADQLAAILVKQRGKNDLATLTVDALKAPGEEAVAPAMAMTAIANLIQVGV